jgi:hypothetical protein
MQPSGTGDGLTARAHLEWAAKRGSESAIDELRSPPFPEQLSYLLSLYFEISKRRTIGMNGHAPLTWQDFAAWQVCTQRDVTPWDFTMIGMIDDAYFASMPRPADTSKKTGKAK